MRIHHRHRARILRRDGCLCRVCKVKRANDIHHIVPQRDGGPDTDDNLISTCPDCHKVIRRSRMKIFKCIYCHDTGILQRGCAKVPCVRCDVYKNKRFSLTKPT